MPAPTTKPSPSPKAPPICKKPPSKGGMPPLPIDRRILAALLKAITQQTGLSYAINASLNLDPLATPGHWAGDVVAGGYLVDVAIFKNPDDENYQIELNFYVGASPFFSQTWSDVTPRTADPLEFADQTYQDPLTEEEATLTIMA